MWESLMLVLKVQSEVSKATSEARHGKDTILSQKLREECGLVFILTLGFCVNCFSVAMIKHPDKKQIKEERIYPGLLSSMAGEA